MPIAVVYAVLGVGLLAAMDVAIKMLGGRLPIFEVAFLRFFAGAIVATGVIAVVRPGWPSRRTIKANAWRSLLVVATATTFFYSLTALPLAEAIALSFVAPLIVALLGVLILKESLSARIAVTLAIGFTGMLVIVAGRLDGGIAGFGGGSGWGVAAAIASAFTYALSLVFLRSIAQRDPVVTIVWFQNAGPALLLSIPAALVWTPPTPTELGLAAGIGVMGVVGHVLITSAFARAPAATLAPIEYTALVWGAAWGFLFFQEIPGLATLAGAALIVGGTLWGQWRRQAATPTAAE